MQDSWTIDETHAGERLDAFLRQQHPEISRSQIQKLIKQKRILVNGKTATVHRFLKTGDTVTNPPLTNPPAPLIKGVGSGSLRPPDKGVGGFGGDSTVTVVAETSDWIVIDKPAGLLTHPDSVTQHPTLVDWLIAHDPKIARVGENPDRPGIVHRLDREVSGLMVIAKTPAAYEALQKQFASRQTKKIYLALVHGNFSKDEGDIKFRIARSSSQARMAARPTHEEKGRAAWTHYLVKERFVGAALVELEIFSGRTHQIRAHLHALGHPVIGDPLYVLRHTDRNVSAPRIMLQSIGLNFQDPITGERRSFSLPPDPAFALLIKKFRS